MISDQDTRFETLEFDCASCGFGPIASDADGTATCPNCHESHSLVVHERFALMETGGWTTRLSIDESGDDLSGLDHR